MSDILERRFGRRQLSFKAWNCDKRTEKTPFVHGSRRWFWPKAAGIL